MKKEIMGVLLMIGITAMAVKAAEVLSVCEEAVIQQQNPDSAGSVGDSLRAAKEPEGAGEKIYLKFDASALSSQISDIESFEGFSMETKYPRGASVFLLPDDKADEWTSGSITWNTAFGNEKASGGTMSSGKSVMIGSFPAITPGTSQTVALEWSADSARRAVVKALNSGNRIVTLVVVRPTTKISLYASSKNMTRDAHPFVLKLKTE